MLRAQGRIWSKIITSLQNEGGNGHPSARLDDALSKVGNICVVLRSITLALF